MGRVYVGTCVYPSCTAEVDGCFADMTGDAVIGPGLVCGWGE